MSATDTALTIPEDLKPGDGRFGCGPSKVRPAQLARLAEGDGAALMGTSHRQKPVKALVGRVRSGLGELFSRARGLRGRARQRRHHRVLGRRDVRPGARARAAPDLRRVLVEVRQGDQRRAVPAGLDRRQGRRGRRARADLRPVGRRRRVGAQRDLDRRDGRRRARRRRAGPDRRHLGRRRPAGGRQGRRRLLLRAAEVLRRRRRAVARADEPGGAGAGRRDRGSGRWIPEFLSLSTALDNSLKDQTYNTPAIATLVLLADQLEWMLGLGGLAGCVERTTASSTHLYSGRRRRSTRRRSSPTRPSARWSSAPWTSTTRSTPPRWPRRCARTGSSTSSRTASSAATSCGWPCSRPSRPEDVKALTACIDYVGREAVRHDARIAGSLDTRRRGLGGAGRPARPRHACPSRPAWSS